MELKSQKNQDNQMKPRRNKNSSNLENKSGPGYIRPKEEQEPSKKLRGVYTDSNRKPDTLSDDEDAVSQ